MEAREETLTPIGQQPRVNQFTSNQEKKTASQLRVERALKPFAKPQEMPAETMRRIFKTDDYQVDPLYEAIIKHLRIYQSAGDDRNWDHYARKKVDDDVRWMFRKLLIEWRRNGFVNPTVFDGELRFEQIRTRGPLETSGGLPIIDCCTLCARDCRIRYEIDSGELKKRQMTYPEYKEKPKCWQVRKDLF